MRQDILIEDGDLMMNGDFVIGQSDQQHVGDIFIAQPGEYKEWPVVGFGAVNYVKGLKRVDEFKRDLKLQLQFDGYADVDIDTTNGIEKTKIKI
ncbi:MAG: hypothetical protein U1C58_06310 [Flavobacteriaceae bacterium]|nr:hypothetical protein [Flavobacteriaceae bacterium]